MTDQPRFLIAKYVPDVFRNEPRNIGVVLWSPDGVVARFAGEKPDAPGEVDDDQIPPFVASPDAYKQWVRYWRREIGKETIRPAGGSPVLRTAPTFLDALGQTGLGNFSLVTGGTLTDPVAAQELPQTVELLYENCVAVTDHDDIQSAKGKKSKAFSQSQIESSRRRSPDSSAAQTPKEERPVRPKYFDKYFRPRDIVDDVATHIDDLRQLCDSLDAMDKLAATVLRMRFGLNDEEPKTLKEVGECLGLTRDRVGQIEREALAKLREGLSGD